MFLLLVLDTAVTGLPYVLPFLGVLVVFRLLDRIDLTIDGSFALGAAVSVVLVDSGLPPWCALLAAGAAGAAAGGITTAVHLLLRVPVLLAGIVMWIGLYSVNLRVMGRPTVAVPSATTVYGSFDGLGRSAHDLAVIGVLAALIGAIVIALGGYLRSESGLALRATGVNTRMAQSQGVDDRRAVAVGLAIANALAALGGGLVAHGQGFAEVNMGTGILISGVAAVLLGELVMRPTPSTVGRALLAVVVGALAYRLVLLTALRVGLPASDLRLVTALTLGATLLARRVGSRHRRPGSGSRLRRPASGVPSTGRTRHARA